jgi:hypothetical protein
MDGTTGQAKLIGFIKPFLTLSYRPIRSFAGYSLHPFRNYFHVNLNSYMAWYWLGAVDRQYPDYLLDLRIPPFCWQPPSNRW